MTTMRALRLGVAGALSTLLGGVVVGAQPQSGAGGAASHVAIAKAAARQDHVGLFNTLCVPPPPLPTPGATPQGVAPQGPPPRAQWYASPVKVFDNLYFLGQTEYTAWAVATSDGIIVIDPLFDYSVEEEVVKGLTTLGLDPKAIKYVLISHAHSDHVGGARLLQDRFGARVVMSAADWDLLASDPGAWPKAKRDIVATDGQKLNLGDTTLTLHFTPGHTLGTISTMSPLLGLLGTIIGMIEIFGSQGPSGVANPAQLAHGISIALYNAAFGIIVAVPSLVFYRHFRARADTLIVEMEVQAVKLVEIIHGERKA